MANRCTSEGHTNNVQQRVDNHRLKYCASDRRMNTIATSDLEAYQVHRLVTQ